MPKAHKRVLINFCFTGPTCIFITKNTWKTEQYIILHFIVHWANVYVDLPTENHDKRAKEIYNPIVKNVCLFWCVFFFFGGGGGKWGVQGVWAPLGSANGTDM